MRVVGAYANARNEKIKPPTVPDDGERRRSAADNFGSAVPGIL